MDTNPGHWSILQHRVAEFSVRRIPSCRSSRFETPPDTDRRKTGIRNDNVAHACILSEGILYREIEFMARFWHGHCVSPPMLLECESWPALQFQRNGRPGKPGRSVFLGPVVAQTQIYRHRTIDPQVDYLRNLLLPLTMQPDCSSRLSAHAGFAGQQSQFSNPRYSKISYP